MCIRSFILCIIFLLFCNYANVYAHNDVELTKIRSNITLDSNNDKILSMNHTFEIKAKLEAVDIILVPHLSYRYQDNAEINLENGYVRMPMGIWSIYGGEKTIAASFYYQKFNKGFFGAISQDKPEESFAGSLIGERKITVGIVFTKLGSDKNTDITLWYSNSVDDKSERRYQTISLKNERKFNNGDKLGYIISNNNRTLNGVQICNYNVLKVNYEHKFRAGYTGKFNFGISHSKDGVSEKDVFTPVFSFKIFMEF